MYEDDRVRALSMYDSMFDETDDENKLLQLLVSPTRQAVNLARSYDAGERSLRAHSQAREAGSSAEEEPAFLQVIERIRDQAAALGTVLPKVSEDQVSLFEDDALDTSVFDDVAATLEEQPAESAPAPVEVRPDRYPDEDAGENPAEPIPEQAPPPEAADDQEAEASSEQVDAFLAGFSIQGDDWVSDEAASPSPDAPPSSEGSSPAEPAEQDSLPESAPAALPDLEQSPYELPTEPAPPQIPAEDTPRQTVRKTRVFLLILFLLLFVPITLFCIALLLLPTLLCLSLGVSTVMLGIAGLSAAFTSFSVIADILLVLGCALVVLALGLLLVWTFIWFVFGAIPGLVRGVIALGRKLCCKEVEVS